jgi:hypothetical protein
VKKDQQRQQQQKKKTKERHQIASINMGKELTVSLLGLPVFVHMQFTVQAVFGV